MKITSLSTAGTHVRPDGVAMTEFFSAAEGAKVTMGHAVFPAGTVVPWAAHDADEYAFILRGSVSCETEEDGLLSMTAGGASFIPAGQRHSSRNDGPEESRAHLSWWKNRSRGPAPWQSGRFYQPSLRRGRGYVEVI
ncbi:MAG: cupin domain-containing protein [Lachnospiraceae bacterium]